MVPKKDTTKVMTTRKRKRKSAPLNRVARVYLTVLYKRSNHEVNCIRKYQLIVDGNSRICSNPQRLEATSRHLIGTTW